MYTLPVPQSSVRMRKCWRGGGLGWIRARHGVRAGRGRPGRRVRVGPSPPCPLSRTHASAPAPMPPRPHTAPRMCGRGGELVPWPRTVPLRACRAGAHTLPPRGLRGKGRGWGAPVRTPHPPPRRSSLPAPRSLRGEGRGWGAPARTPHPPPVGNTGSSPLSARNERGGAGGGAPALCEPCTSPYARNSETPAPQRTDGPGGTWKRRTC